MIYSSMKNIDRDNKRVIGVWQIVSVVSLFTTLIVTAMMVGSVVLDNIFDLFSYSSFMSELFERCISPLSLTSFYLPVLFCSFAPEYLWINITVAVLCMIILSLIGYFTLKIFSENAKTFVRIWIFVMIFESSVSFAFTFTDIFDIFIILVFAFRAITVFSLFMSLKFVDAHYEYYDY